MMRGHMGGVYACGTGTSNTTRKANTMKTCMLSLIGSIIISYYAQAQVCNIPLQALISGDVYNVNESQITVGSEQNNVIPNVTLPNGTGYCANELLLTIPDVSVNFTTQFLIVNFSISGRSDVNNGMDYGYVERLRIVSDDKSVISEIIDVNLANANVNDSEVQNIQLSTPIFARQLRILPYQWTSNPLCIRVEVYGCPADQSTGPATKKEVNFLVVETVIPALGLICIVVVSITIGFLCFKLVETNGDKGKILRNTSVRQDLIEDDSQDRTLKVVNNSLYHSSSILKPQKIKPAAVTRSLGRSYETIDMNISIEAPSTNHQRSTSGNTTSYSVAFTATNESKTEPPQATKKNQYQGNYVEVHESGGADQNRDVVRHPEKMIPPNGSNMQQLYPQYEVCPFNNGQDDGDVLESIAESQGPDHFAV